jgi:hypothetical protein
LIDAGGRTPILPRRLGAVRFQLDNLVCGWMMGEAQSRNSEPGFSYIHSVPQGWWHTAPVPGGERIVSFHTRAGDPATAWLTVGDAVLSFDRLSSQRIFNALYTGLAASESAYWFLQGELSDFAGYQSQLEAIWQGYESHLQEWHRSEGGGGEQSFGRADNGAPLLNPPGSWPS